MANYNILMMKTTAMVILKNRTYEAHANTSIRRMLKDLGIQSDAYLITRDGVLITDDEMLNAGHIIRLIPVISGG
jgi:sulfur carrier protein ThiS